jgi:hypothetical protein
MSQRITWDTVAHGACDLAEVDAAVVVLDANDLCLEEAEALQVLVLSILLANAASG